MRMKIAWMFAGGIWWNALVCSRVVIQSSLLAPSADAAQLATSYEPVWSQVSIMSSRSLSIAMYSTGVVAMRAFERRGSFGDSGWRARPAPPADPATVVASPSRSSTRSPQDVHGALFGVAFSEQNFAGLCVADIRFLDERVQVVLLQAVDGRQSLELSQVRFACVIAERESLDPSRRQRGSLACALRSRCQRDHDRRIDSSRRAA